MNQVQADRELDLAYEAESERMWAAMNHDEAWDRMLEAVGFLNVAIEHMDKATESLISAKDEVEGLPSEYRLGSLIDSFEELVCGFQKMRQQFINGEG